MRLLTIPAQAKPDRDGWYTLSTGSVLQGWAITKAGDIVETDDGIALVIRGGRTPRIKYLEDEQVCSLPNRFRYVAKHKETTLFGPQCQVVWNKFFRMVNLDDVGVSAADSQADRNAIRFFIAQANHQWMKDRYKRYYEMLGKKNSLT